VDPQTLVQIFVQGGFAGILLYVWWQDKKQIDKLIQELAIRQKEWETFTQGILKKLEELSEGIFFLAGKAARLEQKMADNFFCPIVRGLSGITGGAHETGNTDAQSTDSRRKKETQSP
jgi:hypothetical protein